MDDEITCRDCRKRVYCDEPCIFVERIVGKGKSTKELLPPPDPRQISCANCPEKVDCLGRCEKTDYNFRLAAIQDQRAVFRKHTIADIRGLRNFRLKAIAALLYAGFRVADFPEIRERINIKQSQLYAIIKEGQR